LTTKRRIERTIRQRSNKRFMRQTKHTFPPQATTRVSQSRIRTCPQAVQSHCNPQIHTSCRQKPRWSESTAGLEAPQSTAFPATCTCPNCKQRDRSYGERRQIPQTYIHTALPCTTRDTIACLATDRLHGQEPK